MKYDTICLSGGGVRGFCFGGALHYINNNIIKLNLIKNWVGTSIGAIICFLITINYSIEELIDFYYMFDFELLKPKFSIYNLLTINGFDNGNKIDFILSKFLKNKYNINDITFIDHYKLTNKKLVLFGTNYTKGTEAIFDYEKTPNLSVLKALRISMSVSIIYSPVLLDSDYYIDGGYTNAFPMNFCNIETTLGIYIINCEYNNKYDITSLFKTVNTITFNSLNSLIEKINKFTNNKMHIIKISTDDNLHLLRLGINDKMKHDLYNSGVKFAYDFFN
jgi:NTE family protein